MLARLARGGEGLDQHADRATPAEANDGVSREQALHQRCAIGSELGFLRGDGGLLQAKYLFKLLF